MNTKEGKLLALGKRGEFPTKRGYTIRLMECIGEQSNAQGSRQCEAPGCG
jgi:hypothetical protein